MKNLFSLSLGLTAIFFSMVSFASDKETAAVTEKITNEILAHGKAYSDLTELTKMGHRLCGSKNASKAVEWAKKKMESYGFDKVWLQPVAVSAWERGNVERASAVSKKYRTALRITALGGSVSTGKKPIKAQVIEVKSLDEATKLGEKALGKIIFFNGPMDPTKVSTFDAYGGAVDQRYAGAMTAGKVGAVAVLVRSMTLNIDNHPHTGAMSYKDATVQIPAAAVSTQDAEKLSELIKADPNTQVQVELSAHPVGMVDSFNVIGEVTGRDKPDELVVVSGHFDSWDLAQGAQDDGAGVMESLEALRSIHALGLHPRRTIRVVFYMCEENGAAGGKEYAKQALQKKEKHIAAIESDEGGFTPLGFSVQGSERVMNRLKNWGKFLAPIHSDLVKKGYGGTDIEPLAELGTPLFGLSPDSQRYFDYHHAETDTIEAVNPRELHHGASAMAILAYLLAEEGL